MFSARLDLISLVVLCATVRDFLGLCATDQIGSLTDIAKAGAKMDIKERNKGSKEILYLKFDSRPCRCLL